MLRFPTTDPGPVSQPEDRRKLATRLIVVQVAVTVVFAALALAFWYFQVVQHEKFREMAENNHQRTLPLRAPRGVLFDRNGKVLVENRDSFVISIVREQSKNMDRTIRLLARVTGVDEAFIRESIKRHRLEPSYRPIPDRRRRLARAGRRRRRAPPRHGTAGRARRARARLAAIPTDALAAHLFGYVGEVTEEQLVGRRLSRRRHRRTVGPGEELQQAARGRPTARAAWSSTAWAARSGRWKKCRPPRAAAWS